MIYLDEFSKNYVENFSKKYDDYKKIPPKGMKTYINEKLIELPMSKK